MIIIYTTVASEQDAQKIAQELLNKKCIACANWFPITSMFRWEGKLSNDAEYVVLCKTAETKKDDAIKAIEAIHPYDTPCILTFDVDANKKFASWVNGEIS